MKERQTIADRMAVLIRRAGWMVDAQLNGRQVMVAQQDDTSTWEELDQRIKGAARILRLKNYRVDTIGPGVWVVTLD